MAVALFCALVCTTAQAQQYPIPTNTAEVSGADKFSQLGKAYGTKPGFYLLAGLNTLEQTLQERDARIQQFTAEQSTSTPKDSNHFGRYTPGRGFKVADTEYGDLSIRFFTYVRYLNQMGLDGQFTNASGQTSTLDRRQDILHNKLSFYFNGWLMDRKFRYLFFIWTSNASQGLGAQVANTGYLTYEFDKHFTLGGGVYPLPGVRTTEGSFPNWLTVDNRLISDEFFRPSYSYGIFAQGIIVDRVRYATMLANNLSALGVDAGQLDNTLDTWSTSVVWTPTTGEFGPGGEFGDFENHQSVATRVGAHFTQGTENFQAQANPDAFENVQVRVSDGRSIFTPELFGANTRVTDARIRMTSWDAGIKYHGFSLEGEYYWRWVNEFRGTGVGGLSTLHDNGFQLQASGMVVPQTIQLYVGNSKVFGEYGDPWDLRGGLNWFPWKNRVVRWNFEYIYLNRSPVGGLSLPYSVGATGPVVHTDFVVNF